MRAVIISHQRITGLTAAVIAGLVEEIGPLWQERHQARLAAARVVGSQERVISACLQALGQGY